MFTDLNNLQWTIVARGLDCCLWKGRISYPALPCREDDKTQWRSLGITQFGDREPLLFTYKHIYLEPPNMYNCDSLVLRHPKRPRSRRSKDHCESRVLQDALNYFAIPRMMATRISSTHVYSSLYERDAYAAFFSEVFNRFNVRCLCFCMYENDDNPKSPISCNQNASVVDRPGANPMDSLSMEKP